MYDWPELEAANNAFWLVIRDHFREAGFDAPEYLLRGGEGADNWLKDNMLFSQTCGYPFATQLIGKVHLLGTPHYDVEGCDGPTYSSAIIVRADDERERLSDFKSSRFAFNSPDSLSGFRCLSPLIGSPENWFNILVESGAHRVSGSMVADDRADVAALDAVCWNYFQRFEPDAAARLRVLRWTPKLPSLPYITAGTFGPDDVRRMQIALQKAVNRSRESGGESALGICGMSVVAEQDYTPLAEL